MAMNLPVDSKVTQCIDSFIREVDSDFHAPHQSNFQDFMPKVKRDVQAMEEVHFSININIPLITSFVTFYRVCLKTKATSES